ncbi:MAG: VOC family protein [Candidatus Eremiobacteraeota bacterium]|nr:VOC family protein [Candidatus Eremiobacteraeota bacterium]
MPLKFERAIPILRMFDVDKAREFYLDYLGFSVEFQHRFHDGAPLFMGVVRDGLQLFLSEHHGDGTPGTHVIVQMSGIEEFHRTLLAKNYRYMNPGIEVTEWGTREVCVVDPFNNQIVFSEQVARVTPAPDQIRK